MNEPEGTGSDKERRPGEGIKLPSWIDAAIARTQEEVDADDAAREAETRARAAEFEALADDAVEPMTEEPPRDYPHPEPDAPTEPFPSFLDRRGSMQYEAERIADEEKIAADARAFAREESKPADRAFPQPVDDFEAQRAEIVSQALAEDRRPATEPIPLPVAPPRRRAPSGPWLMAAVFFAAAALVLAVLIWLRPIQR